MRIKTLALSPAVALLMLCISLPTAQAKASANETHTKQSVVETAKQYIGVPYCRGGSGPRCFDCSGFVSYVYKKHGTHLPRTAQAQYRAVKHIPKKQAQPGDLIFFLSGNHVYHVGIYLGGNRVLHSPKTGHRVRIERIWTSNVKYGRL